LVDTVGPATTLETQGEEFLDADSPSEKNEKNGSKSNFIRRLLFGKLRVRSEEELQEVINASEEEGIINEEEGEMLHSIFEFGETIVREIMVPRTDMTSCSTEATLVDLLKAIIDSGHSRIPIYQGSNDRIVGLVYAKDLLKYWGKDDDLKISEVMRPPFFVPETKKIEELLKEFRTRRVHMAIAIDEYGGTSGLVTFEDLLEEIVGDIQDEYDLEEEWLMEEEDGSMMVDCRLNIDDFADHFDVRIPREKFDTVGGWLFDLLGHVPLKGEKTVFGNLAIEVVECDERKIRLVRVQKMESENQMKENG
jgi:CBS domain containing-hemolysin-like protein